MKKHLLLFFLFIEFFGCNSSNKLSSTDSTKSADNFARNFITKIISRQLEISFADINIDVLNDTVKKTLTKASILLNGATVKKYKVAEASVTSFFSKSGNYNIYRLGYEYEFDKGNVLFLIKIKEESSKFSVVSFKQEILTAPLAELTKFTLTNKSVLQYFFLLITILVPLFTLTTLIIMFLNRMSIKKKIIWALIILLISLPHFVINWNTGQLNFLLGIGFGTGFSKPTLYSAWLLHFYIPIGAIMFWYKRKSLTMTRVDVENS